MADDPDALARLVHETRHKARAGLDRPFIPEPWEERPEALQDVDRAIAAAIRDAVLNSAPAGGELVRETWVYWALEQPDVAGHPNWLKSWAEIDERDREVDDRIYSAVAAKAVHDAGLEGKRMRLQLIAFAAERDRAVAELKRRASRAVPGIVRDAWLGAVDVVLGTQERSDEKEPS